MKTQLLKITSAALMLLVLVSCDRDNVYLGEVETEVYIQEPFSKVSLETIGEIRIHESTEYKVEIETSLALFDNFDLQVINNELVIRSRFSNQEQRSIKVIIIDIYAPTYTGIELAGVSDVTALDGISGDHLDLELKGVGKMEMLDLNFNSINVVQKGVGNIELSGTVNEASYTLRSTGSIEAFPLEANMVEARVTGIGSIKLFALEELDATIQGIGSIYYKGNPTIQQSINGIGKLIDAN